MKWHTDTKATVGILICAEIPLLNPKMINNDYKPPIQTPWHTARTVIHWHIKLTLKKKNVPGNLQESLMLLSRVPDVDILYFSLKCADELKAGPINQKLQLKWGWRMAKEHLIFCRCFYSISSSSMSRNAETLPAQGHRARDAAGVRKAGNVPFTNLL